MSVAVEGRRVKVEGMVRYVVLAACVLMASGCDSSKGDRLMRMIRQPKYKAYETSEFWDDGRAMRVPPEGTVAREMRDQLPLMDWQNPDGTFKDSFPAPLTVDAAFLKKGQKRFNIICANCHGQAGDGKSIPGENMALRAPPTLLTAALRERPVGYFYEVITHGFGLMPSYQGEVSIEDRWAVAAYVRALQASQGVPLADVPAPVQQQLKAKPQVPPEQMKEML